MPKPEDFLAFPPPLFNAPLVLPKPEDSLESFPPPFSNENCEKKFFTGRKYPSEKKKGRREEVEKTLRYFLLKYLLIVNFVSEEGDDNKKGNRQNSKKVSDIFVPKFSLMDVDDVVQLFTEGAGN